MHDHPDQCDGPLPLNTPSHDEEPLLNDSPATPPASRSGFGPTRLIDLEHRPGEIKLVERTPDPHRTTTNDAYAALSYVWGKDQPILTTETIASSDSGCASPAYRPHTRMQ